MNNLFDRINTTITVTGSNRFQMLTFRIGPRPYGINVAKIIEIIPPSHVHKIPGQHALVQGVVSLRGRTIPVIDLAGTLRCESFTPKYLVVTEFNRHVQAFMISDIDEIHSVDWEDVKPPSTDSLLTGIAHVNNKPIGILDMEAILAPLHNDPDEASKIARAPATGHGKRVLVVDDSTLARKQVRACLDAMGFTSHEEVDGQQAWQHLLTLEEDPQHYDLIISDIEMPQLDGYSLTRKIKRHAQLKTIPVILHSSLSGQHNTTLARNAGAEYLLSKFRADELQALLEKALTNAQKNA
jgi:two-component system, chemotaxis family, chemotaxis protein CheV